MARGVVIAGCGLLLAQAATGFLTPSMPSRGVPTKQYSMSTKGKGDAQPGNYETYTPKPLDLDGMAQDLGSVWMAGFQKKYNELVTPDGPNSEPMEMTMNRFNAMYSRPVIPFYRNVLYDLVQTAHLAVFDPNFVYTRFFAYGFVFAFETIFKGYPLPGEWVPFFEAAAKAAKLDPAQLKKDADVLKQWFSSHSKDDFIRALTSPKDGDEVERDIYAIKNNLSASFPAERYFSYGLCQTMKGQGIEPNFETIKTWCEALGLDETRTQLDWDLYERTTNKLADVELLMKQVEIREKKRLAERLEAKAKKAADAAAASVAEASSTPVVPAPAS